MKTKLPFYTEEEILWLATCDGIGQREKRKTLAAIQARHVTETAGLVELLEAASRYVPVNAYHGDIVTKSKDEVNLYRQIRAALAALAAAKQS